jgi:hypothetical protein
MSNPDPASSHEQLAARIDRAFKRQPLGPVAQAVAHPVTVPAPQAAPIPEASSAPAPAPPNAICIKCSMRQLMRKSCRYCGAAPLRPWQPAPGPSPERLAAHEAELAKQKAAANKG